jgi:hypothetical protein
MKSRYMLMIGAATLAALASGGLAAAHDGQRSWRGHHGWSPRAHGLEQFCNHRHAGTWLASLSAMVERSLSLHETQTAAWRRVIEEVRAVESSLVAICDAEKFEAATRSATVLLARAESMMTARLDALRRVRPTFEAFYGSLDDGQKKALDDLLARRRR